MNGLRFATANDLYETFPTAQGDVGMPPNDADSLAFLQQMVAAGSWDQAVSFCAYLLPRREAVWWGCQSLRQLQPQLSSAEAAALDAAEAWVHEPEEDLRRDTLTLGMRGDVRQPAIWMALAAGWAGGSVMPPEYGGAPTEPHQTARAVRAALLVAMTTMPTDAIPQIVKPCLESGMQLAAGQH